MPAGIQLALVLLAAAPVLHVRAGAPAGGDGSDDRPFAKVQDALGHSPAGAELAIEAGLYEESLTLDHPVTLRGHGQVVLAAPPGSAAAVVVRSSVALIDVSIQGGRVGLLAEHGTSRLERVRLSGQPDAAMSCAATCDLHDVHIESSFASAVGLRGQGAIHVDVLALSGPFRRAVELVGASLDGRGLEITGAVTGLHGSNANVHLRDAHFSELRGTCAFASAGTLELTEPVIAGCEVGLEVRADARLTVRGGLLARCSRAAVTAVGSHVSLQDTVSVGPSRDGMLMLVGGDAELRGVQARQPGPTAVTARGAKLAIDGLVVEGAVLQGQDFGNAMFLFSSEVRGQGLLARRCAGAAVETQVGAGRLADLEVEQAGLAALALENNGRLDVDGLLVRDSPTAIACIEHGQGRFRALDLRGVAQPYLVDCSCRISVEPKDPALVGCAPVP